MSEEKLGFWEINKIKWKKGGTGDEIKIFVASPSFEKVIELLEFDRKDPFMEIISVSKLANIDTVL